MDCRTAPWSWQIVPTTPTLSANRSSSRAAVPNIPPKRTRIWKSCFSRVLYRRRNAIERMFCRLKDYRRIATRYDKLATNCASSVYLAAAISFWV